VVSSEFPRWRVLPLLGSALAILICTPNAVGRPRGTVTHEVVCIDRPPPISPAELTRQVWIQPDLAEIGPYISNNARIGYLEFPRNSNVHYLLQAWLVCGGIVGTDTLVSNDSSYPPELNAFEPFIETSNRPGASNYSPDAVAQQQLYAVCYDTIVLKTPYLDAIESRIHKPIGLEIHQMVYTWSDTYSKRFVILNWWIKNIASRPINKFTVGIRALPTAQYTYSTNWPYDISGYAPGGYGDNIVGFVQTVPGIVEGSLDTINIVWWADNDGDPTPDGRSFHATSATGVAGIRVLRAPGGSRHVAFNWWVNSTWVAWPPEENWGPRRRADHVLYRGSLGLPVGDRGMYHMMTNGEIDYDQVFASIDYSSEGWIPPPEYSYWISSGESPYFLVSADPVQVIYPNDSVPFTIAVVCGSDFHRFPGNFSENFNANDPSAYLGRLNFKDLIGNARWADWVFDNPGVDTDGDGDRGAAYVTECHGSVCDSVFYRGDGVPDWNGPSAPPPPRYEVTTRPGKLILQWDGATTETFVDAFSRWRDFEGYRIYVGKLDQDAQYSLTATWDREDFKRFAYDSESGKWNQVSDPFSIGDWRDILRDEDFDPRDYARPSLEMAYRDSILDTTLSVHGEIISIEWRERLSYWAPKSYNRGNDYFESDRWEQNLIQKIAERDTVIDGEPLTYGVYSFTLNNLNPAIPLFCAITAFDFGDFRRHASPLESSPSANSEYFEPLYSADIVRDSGLRVSVYPNPYKAFYLDHEGKRTTYYDEGYEGRGVVDFVEQDRRIHFINLPDTATITIYSLDGDLIRQIHHPDPYLTTYSSSVGWDLITRNTQAVVSGIYIWKVDSKLGSQTGKLVIIK
jgi:hypothetical protein